MKPMDLIKGTGAMLVLKVLSGEELHGYAIVQKLRAQSKGAFEMKEGTLYPILHALEAEGLVQAIWEGEGRRKRVYSITESGKKRLDTLLSEWDASKRAVDLVLGDACYGM